MRLYSALILCALGIASCVETAEPVEQQQQQQLSQLKPRSINGPHILGSGFSPLGIFFAIFFSGFLLACIVLPSEYIEYKNTAITAMSTWFFSHEILSWVGIDGSNIIIVALSLTAGIVLHSIMTLRKLTISITTSLPLSFLICGLFGFRDAFVLGSLTIIISVILYFLVSASEFLLEKIEITVVYAYMTCLIVSFTVFDIFKDVFTIDQLHPYSSGLFGRFLILISILAGFFVPPILKLFIKTLTLKGNQQVDVKKEVKEEVKQTEIEI